MIPIYLTYGCLISPLGNSIEENRHALLRNESGVKTVKNSGVNNEDWPLAKITSLFEGKRYKDLLKKACDALLKLHGSALFESKDTLIILSSTKADIDDLEGDPFASSRNIITESLHPSNKIIIVSNACISGVIAINTAADYIQSKKFKTVVVIGIDVLSDFIVYGFQSLFAISDVPSKPFDADRKGISIGEAAGSLIVSDRILNPDNFHVNYMSGSSSNDANHISGPSRTGEGLFRSVNRTIEKAGIDRNSIDFISAHGTGTSFNDEMESIAFKRLELSQVPMNSLKGYFGHTLGAAGVIEIISTLITMENDIVFKSLGFEKKGTSESLNIAEENLTIPINIALKTASGFGGGNASLILQKLARNHA